jgi:RNA polymerase sigma-70 factor (ECF subfamily)
MPYPSTSLSGLFQAANEGDAEAYRSFLTAVSVILRASATARLTRLGESADEAEDIVQECLLAIHLKRGTWKSGCPVEPWILAIMRHKLIDHIRRKGWRRFDDISEYENELAQPASSRLADGDCAALIQTLPGHQQVLVQKISIEGRSAREVGATLGQSEGSVRIALHRALRRLAAVSRKSFA